MDYVNHAMLLFTDFVAVFVRILVIMVSQATMRWNSLFLLWTLAVLITTLVCCLCIFMWNLHGSICCTVEEFHWEGWEEEEKEGLRVYLRSSSRTSDASWNLGWLMWNLVHKYAFFLNWTKLLLILRTMYLRGSCVGMCFFGCCYVFGISFEIKTLVSVFYQWMLSTCGLVNWWFKI